MSRETREPAFEPERYELFADEAAACTLTRRELLKTLGAGLLIVLCVSEVAALQRPGGRGEPPREIGAWLHVGEDGTVTVYTGKTEVGQNIRTSLAQVVAEELRTPLASVRLVMADTDLTPFDMGTFGSRTTPVMAAQLRQAAATARELVLDLAAEQFPADRAGLAAADGKVTHAPTGRSLGYGEITRGRKLVKPVAAAAPTTAPEQWKVAGRSAPKVDGRALVTGKHRYASDIRLPGMLCGRVLRPPALNAERLSLDTRAAEAMAAADGVGVVRDGEFVGVVAPDERTAARALEAIRAEWKIPPQPAAKELFEYLKANPAEGRGGRGSSPHVQGSVREALAAADRKHSAAYTIAYIAHAPLEPRAAAAEWKGGRLTVWTGTQRPFGVRSELAQAFGIPEAQVRVIVPDTGSGYGGKHTGEAAVEAARLAKAAGKPVRVLWTREEEFTWAYFRPAGLIEVTSGVMNDGRLTAWEFHNYNSGGSSIRPLYEIPAQHVQFHGARSPLRQGSYRALAATANHFARESHLDDVAHSIGMDPLEFRLKNLKDERFRAVLQAAADRFGWETRPKGPGKGAGIAGGFEKGGYVATCAEVEVDERTRKVRVTRVVAAFECGAVLNPEHLKTQVEGCVVMGLGGALFEAIDFEDGKILSRRFSSYRVPRFSDIPPIEVVLLDRKDLPSAGAGETPIVGIAPAIGNALFAAAGVRVRSLPMLPRGTVPAAS